MTQFNRFNITKWYLYGQSETPENLVDSSLIRPESATSNAPDVNLVDFMSTGAGRFAVGSQFELVQRFFLLNVPEGEYTKNELFYDVFGLGSFDPDPFFGWKMQQFNYDDGIDDYLDRVWVYNSMAFKISDEARFIVDENGNKRIDNFAVIPINETEDFDFETSNLFTAIGNAAALSGVDPSGIGRKVIFKYANLPPLKTYTKTNFEQDFQNSKSWKISDLQAYIKIISLKDEFINGLFEEGATRFLDDNNKPILYGTVNADNLSANKVTPGFTPTLYKFKDNGVVLITAGGNDALSGSSNDDVLIGGKDQDTLVGFSGADILIGDEGNDKLDGGKDQDKDVAVFSDDFANYNYSISSEFFGLEKTITFDHTEGTQTDGTDTLKNIEFAQFKDGIASLPLEDGEKDTLTGTNIFSGTNTNDPNKFGFLSQTLPISMLDGNAEYTVTFSAIKPDTQYNIAFIIDTSASMNATELLAAKNAYISLTNHFINTGIADVRTFSLW